MSLVLCRSHVYRAVVVLIMAVIVAVGAACQSAHAVPISSAPSPDQHTQIALSTETAGAHHRTSVHIFDLHCATQAVMPGHVQFDTEANGLTGEHEIVIGRPVAEPATDTPPPKMNGTRPWTSNPFLFVSIGEVS